MADPSFTTKTAAQALRGLARVGEDSIGVTEKTKTTGISKANLIIKLKASRSPDGILKKEEDSMSSGKTSEDTGAMEHDGSQDSDSCDASDKEQQEEEEEQEEQGEQVSRLLPGLVLSHLNAAF